MFLKKTEKKLFKLPSSPNYSLTFGIGFLVFAILIFSIFIGRHLREVHRPKINSLEKVISDITFSYLQVKDTLNIVNATSSIDNKPHILEAKTLLNNLLFTVDWEDFLLPLYTVKQQKDIETVLQKINKFQTQLQIKKPSLTLTINRNTAYKNLVDRLRILQNFLNKRFESQRNKLYRIQIFNLLLLIIYFAFTYFKSKRYDFLNKAFLESRKENIKLIEESSYFLEESQNISKLGYYIYNFDTKIWKASKTIKNILGFEVQGGSLKTWISLIHPDDKHILIDVIDKRKEDSSYPLDVIYRIATSDNKTRWIHHLEQPVKKDKQGNLLPVLGVIQEITEQKETEIDLFDAPFTRMILSSM